MKMEFFIAVALIAFVALFGCTQEEKVIYDCSKCNTTVDCSKCTTDCSKCGPDIRTVPIEIKSGLSLIIPPACTDELCGISKTKGWAGELGLNLQVYNADWAQGPILLMYTENKAGIIKPMSRLDFMQSVCEFVNSTKACTFYREEFKNAKSEMKACLQNSSLSLDTVAFYHTNSCPHCAKMKPWVQELEQQGYKFLWAEASDTTNMTIAQSCLSSILKFSQGVPQFACPANGAWQLGEFASKDDMVNFVKDCVAAAG